MKSFLLIDDHAVIRSALKMILQNQFGNIGVDEAFDADSAMLEVRSRQHTMIIMDVSMPNTDSLSLVQNILAQRPDTKILIFSMNAEEVYAKRYLKMGAKGYLKKDASEAEINKAILCVLNGKRYISSALADILVSDSFSERTDSPFEKLTAREFEILQHLLKGNSVSHICKQLFVNASTISSHKNKIFQKLGVHNMVEVNKMAQVYNIVN